jgi:hypothetical protein
MEKLGKWEEKGRRTYACWDDPFFRAVFENLCFIRRNPVEPSSNAEAEPKGFFNDCSLFSKLARYVTPCSDDTNQVG